MVEWSPELRRRLSFGMARLRDVARETRDPEPDDPPEAVGDTLQVLIDQRALVRACAGQEVYR